MKYLVTAAVTTTATVGYVEADSQSEAWQKANELCQTVKDKHVQTSDIDCERFYFENLESVELCEGEDYVVPKWRG
jgi:hypothetical protein